MTDVNEAVRAMQELSARVAEDQNAQDAAIHDNAIKLGEHEGRLDALGGVEANEQQRVLQETSRQTAEQARALGETGRISAETERVTNESGRETAEDARVAAEGDRADAETARVLAEIGRVSAENDRESFADALGTSASGWAAAEGGRVTAETARASNETARQTAETSRASNETARETAETGRATAESGRVAAETARASAETTRGTNETARVSAETTRGTNETARVAAESARVAAEAARAGLSTAALAVGTGFGAWGRPIGSAPITGSDVTQGQHVFLEPATEDRTIKTIVAWNPTASSKTIKVKRFTRGATFVQLADGAPGSTTNAFSVVIPAGPGLQTVVLGTPLAVKEGEYVGVYCPTGAISTVAAQGDNGGYAFNSADATGASIISNNNASVQLQISLQWEATKVTATRVDAVVSDANVLRQTRNREATGRAGVPWWVEDPTMFEVNFTVGLVWNPDQPGVITSIDEHFNIRSGAGWALDRFGRRRYFPANQPRTTDRGLHYLPLAVTNLVTNPAAPATQTVTVTNGATYWVSVEGTIGNVTLTGAVSNKVVYPGQNYTFVASGTSLTMTVSGDVTFMQLEVDNGGKPSGMAVGTQQQDEIWIKDGSALDQWINAAASTVIVEFERERVFYGAIIGGERGIRMTVDGTDRVGAEFRRADYPTTPLLANAGATGGNPSGAASVVNTLWNINRFGISTDGSGTSLSANGRTATSDANPRGRFRYIGKGLDNPATRAPTSRHRRILVAKSRLSDSELAARCAFDYGLTRTVEYYQSSLDPATFPRLRMRTAFDKKRAQGQGPLPLLVLGHGTNGRDTDFTTETMGRFAKKGFFVVAFDLRTTPGWTSGAGYDASGRDSQGRMAMDLIDGMKALRKRYPDVIDWNNRTISGYSGAECYSLAMKAPFLFDLIVAHFNIPDYEAHLAYSGTVQTAARTTGGYASRNAIVGIPKNRRTGHLIIGYDTADTQVNPASNDALVAALVAAGLTPHTVIKTTTGDPQRMGHGNPTTTSGNTGGLEFEDVWVGPALAGKYSRGLPGETGTGFYIPGFLFLGDPLDEDTPLIMLGSGSTAGTQHAADLTSYDLAARTFTINPAAASTPVTITWNRLTAAQTISASTTLTAT